MSNKPYINVFVGKAFPHGTISSNYFENAEMSDQGTVFILIGDDHEQEVFSYDTSTHFQSIDGIALTFDDLLSTFHADVHLVNNALWLSSHDVFPVISGKPTRELNRRVKELILFHYEHQNGIFFNEEYLEFEEVSYILLNWIHDYGNPSHFTIKESLKYLEGPSYRYRNLEEALESYLEIAEISFLEKEKDHA